MGLLSQNSISNIPPRCFGKLAQLKELQPKGYAMPGVPAIHAVVKGSEYEAKFFDVRTKIPIFGRA